MIDCIMEETYNKIAISSKATEADEKWTAIAEFDLPAQHTHWICTLLPGTAYASQAEAETALIEQAKRVIDRS